MRLLFRQHHRLRTPREFREVFGAKLACPAGPITVHARPNSSPDHRLGLSIGRRFGKAHDRTAFKRRIREAFRLHQQRFPVPPEHRAYDIVITARPHEILKTDDYARLILQAIDSIDRTLKRRLQRQQDS